MPTIRLLTDAAADAGRQIAYSLFGSESMDTWVRVLKIVRNACEHHMPIAKTWKPSAFLVDNSDAEIGAIRHDASNLAARKVGFVRLSEYYECVCSKCLSRRCTHAT